MGGEVDIPHAEFKRASPDGQQQLIVAALVRSLSMMPELGVEGVDVEKLEAALSEFLRRGALFPSKDTELGQDPFLETDQLGVGELARVRDAYVDDATRPARAWCHHVDAIGEVDGFVDVVRDEQAGRAIARENA